MCFLAFNGYYYGLMAFTLLFWWYGVLKEALASTQMVARLALGGISVFFLLVFV